MHLEEREVRGGIGMGNTCKPMAVSFQCMTKFTTNKKKKKKALSVESFSRVWLCDPMDCSTPAFPVHQNSQSSLKLMSSSLWCHPTISSSVVPFSSCLQSFPASRSFQMSQLSTCLGLILDTPKQLILAWENPWAEKGAWWPTDHGVAEELDTT